jgi:hypothetical protein
MSGEGEIRCAVIAQLGEISDYEGAQNFLLQVDLYKNQGARFVSWLVVFRLIPPARVHWPSHMRTLSVQYHNLIGRLYKNGTIDSVDLLDPSTAHVICADTMRTVVWFMRLSHEIGLSDAHLDDAEQRTRRILATICLDSTPLLYTQGHDRYIWVSYLLSLSFSVAGGLPRDFAEALAFNLGRAFVHRCDVSKNIDNFPFIERHFILLDGLVRREAPRVADLLERCSHSSLHYALKWQLTLFADEHGANALLFLWDQILARESRMDEFVRCLCVGHVLQVPIPADGDERALVIQKHRSWDVARIVADAAALMAPEENSGCARAAEEICRRCIAFWCEYRRIR